jgi:hypothetical protein
MQLQPMPNEMSSSASRVCSLVPSLLKFGSPLGRPFVLPKLTDQSVNARAFCMGVAWREVRGGSPLAPSFLWAVRSIPQFGNSEIRRERFVLPIPNKNASKTDGCSEYGRPLSRRLRRTKNAGAHRCQTPMTSPATRCFGNASSPCSWWRRACWAEGPFC